ncbi:glycosyltransferase family 4 protein [Alphaproteobacteria bacterium]|nr:glycosyltransferase family 4 protein [Alphaproteobacteria bacterium]
MKINILLPYKEEFDENKASSVSITVKNNLVYTDFLKDIKVYGQNVEKPLFKDNFVGINYNFFSFKSKNRFLADEMLSMISKSSENKQLIEIHNRPYLIDQIVKKNNLPVSIFFHNDPQTMKGSKYVKDRENILEKCAAVFCVSEYIKNRFIDGITIHNKKVYVLNNGVDRKIKKFPIKKKEILFVGRLVPEKGVDLYVEVIKSIAFNNPEWSFGLIGSFKLGENKVKNSFAKMVTKKFNQIGSQANFYGFKDQNFVEQKMKTASIIVIPSLWQEPFGLVAAEAMSYGTAIIASKVGGIPEIIKDNGILIENINFEKLQTYLIKLMQDRKMRNTYQMKAWKNFNHSSNLSSKKLDNFRKTIFYNYY